MKCDETTRRDVVAFVAFVARFCVIATVVGATACVQSSGIEPQTNTSNLVSIDGAKAKSWKTVDVEIPANGKEYADGYKARLRAIVDELTVVIEIGDFGKDAQDVVPFSTVQITATDGSDSTIAYQALSGALTVKSGDGSPGSKLDVTLADIDMVDVCTGAHKKITTADINGTATDGDFTAAIGVGGFTFTSAVSTSFYDSFDYIGIVGGQSFTNSHGISFFQSGSAESCSLQNPRPNHHLFTAAIVPSEVPSGGGAIDLATTPQSFFFVSEVDATGATIRRALATQGTFDVDGDITLTDGAVLSGTLSNLSLAYIDANQNFTNDPPMTIASMSWKSVFGKPVIP